MQKDKIKIALVQDWLTEMGGAEKVFSAFLSLYPEADIYTLTSRKEVIKALNINKERLNESFINRLPFGRSKYRNYLALFPKAIESFDFSEYDLVISSSYCVAKGVLTNAKQLHLCYCHSPVRYAWDLHHQYLKETKLNGMGLKALYARHILHKLRIWDIVSANRVDFFISNSHYIKKRIKKVYRRKAEVVYPPVNLDRFQFVEHKEDYYFTASRLVPYKKIDLIVKAFKYLPNKRLVVAGYGPEYDKIKKIAGPNVELKGYVSDEEMVSLMSRAKAFVFAADEDFGIVPIEAQACGTPVIAYGIGGVLETVIDDKTGVFFKEQTHEALIEAINHFEKIEVNFDRKYIRRHAEKFSTDRFKSEFTAFVDKKVIEFFD